MRAWWPGSAPALLERLTSDIVTVDVIVRARNSMPLVPEPNARAKFVVRRGYAPEADLGTIDDATEAKAREHP